MKGSAFMGSKNLQHRFAQSSFAGYHLGLFLGFITWVITWVLFGFLVLGCFSVFGFLGFWVFGFLGFWVSGNKKGRFLLYYIMFNVL